MNSIEERDATLADARQIVDGAKNAGRDLTGDEVKELNEKVGKVKALGEQIELTAKGDAVIKALGFGGPGPGADPDRGYLDLSPAGMKQLATRFAGKMIGTEYGTGRKSILTAGESVLSVPVLPADPITLASTPLNLLSILPAITIPAGAAATYVRQSTRTPLAAATAPGGLKPTTILGLSAVPVALKVYATLGEPTDRFLVDDAPALAQFVASELLRAVSSALEADVIAGDPDGVGGNEAAITGLLKTADISTQSFATDLLTSLRAALTQAEGLGYTDSLVYALSAGDWAAAETARASTSGTFDVSTAPLDAAPRRIWGVPVVVVTGLPTKTGILLDRSSVALYSDRQGVRVDWASPGTTWTTNEIVARCEGRWDLAVFQPKAVCSIATATS